MRRPKRSAGRSGSAWRSISAIVKAEEPTCAYCHKVVRYDVEIGHPDRGTVDHVIPLAQGGPELDRTNLCVACTACQGAKGNRTPEQWARDRARASYSFESPLRLN